MYDLKKKLIYNFYISNSTYNSKTNKIHLYCLERYSNIFDILHFVIMKDNDCSEEILMDIRAKLFNLSKHQTLIIDIVPNSPFRESETFYRECVQKLDENNIVFFGHNKGITNITDDETHNQNIFKWIVGCYFFSLEAPTEVIKCLEDTKSISYGSYLTLNDDSYLKYKWIYNGTFMWINEGKLKNYIVSNSIKMPLLNDRFYDEEFLGNTYDTWPLPYAMSKNSQYLHNATDFYNNGSVYTDILLDMNNEKDSYYKIYNDVMEKIYSE